MPPCMWKTPSGWTSTPMPPLKPGSAGAPAITTRTAPPKKWTTPGKPPAIFLILNAETDVRSVRVSPFASTPTSLP